MKTFKQLTQPEKVKAIEHFRVQVVQSILEGSLCFNDELNGDNLQARIDAAIAKADAMQTPWFAHEYLYDDAEVGDTIDGIAKSQAEDTLYSEGDEYVLNGIVNEVVNA